MPDTAYMKEISRDLPTKSAKIRALAAAGYARADIARFLDIRYQHVRNVLVQAAPRNEPAGGAAAPVADELQSMKVKMNPDGRIVIPAEFRAAMKVEDGDMLAVAMDQDGIVRLVSPHAAMRRAQRLTKELIPGNDSLAESLLNDRRREVALEEDNG